MRIQNNIPALNTFRQLGVNNTGSAKALEKLSSGFRINRAGDDAAGLAISEKMRAQIRGLNRASANAQDGISLIQAAEGALQETHSILHRMRELAVQGANDVLEPVDRQAIQDEINQLTKEVDRIAFTTEFNKKIILDGSLTNGKYISTVSGSGISSLTIIPADGSDPDNAIKNALTTVAVVQAGQQANATYDLKFINEPDADPVKGGIVQEGYQGVITIVLGEAMMRDLGIEDQDADATFKVSVEVGDTADVVAGKVRDMLQAALGNDWEITSSDSKLNVKHKFVGNYGVGEDEAGLGEFTLASETDFLDITFEGEDDIFEIGSDIHDSAQGTSGQDVYIEINGEPFDFSADGVETNMFTFGDVAAAGALRGRDSLRQIALSTGEPNGDNNGRFSFKLDDPTRMSNAIVSIDDGSDLTLQVGANTGYTQTIALSIRSLSAVSLGVAELNVSNHAKAQNAIAATEFAITQVSTQRAALGAVQNRLEHTISNLDTVAENLQDAESRIRDVDMAKEMMNFTKFSILMQASQAMMAQANSLPQGVLQLLR
ncbi:MAG: flagellin [Oscillospiraceae bacterium]|nr:flagellin [Oscillospiraceae bacterium]